LSEEAALHLLRTDALSPGTPNSDFISLYQIASGGDRRNSNQADSRTSGSDALLLDILDPSTHAYNCLRDAGFYTAAEFINPTERQIEYVSGLTTRTV
jgi:hypothetical protein